MPNYHKLGKLPPKRHTIFRQPNGELYAEQLISAEGFSDLYSLTYHCHPPTMITHIEEPFSVKPVIALETNMQHRSYLGFNIDPEDDYIKSRKVLFVNADLTMALAAPRTSMKYFFKNALADELVFVHFGEGVLNTHYGKLPFKAGDHIVIPRSTTYQFEFFSEQNKLLIVESYSPIRFPGRYLNNSGQFLEHSPMYERDIKLPMEPITINKKGDFTIMVKKQDLVFPYHYAYHPFDVIGWDGYVYPYTFSIYDFEPITGRIHMPPPIHQTFETAGFVTCAFVPRLFDYHPQAIPAPYNHANIDSDEILYYVEGDFMSRNDIQQGQITLHPMGIPHGPHPGSVERSIGAKETHEYAFMLDTFKPLQITKEALKIEVTDYFKSWLHE